MTGKDNQRFLLAQCAWAIDSMKPESKSTAQHGACPFFHPENKLVTCDCQCHTAGAI